MTTSDSFTNETIRKSEATREFDSDHEKNVLQSIADYKYQIEQRNTDISEKDSQGNTLTKTKAEYFAESKVRDEKITC